MTSSIIDTNHNVTSHLDNLRAAGIKQVIRYDNRLGPNGEKQVKPAEAQAMAAADMGCGIVNEGAGDRLNQFNDEIGYLDAHYSRVQASRRGQPSGSAIYFAVDFDASAGQARSAILPHFRGVTRAFTEDDPTLPSLRVGVYGSGLVCRMVKEAGLCELTWISCSTGWTESHEWLASGQWDLRQYLPKTIAGIDTDPDEARQPDWGAFMPWGGEVPPAPPPQPVHDARWVQLSLNRLGASPLLDVDGVVGKKTKQAVRMFQAAHAPLVVDGIAGPQTILAIEHALGAL